MRRLRHPVARLRGQGQRRAGLHKPRAARLSWPLLRLRRAEEVRPEDARPDAKAATLAEQSLAAQSKLLTPVSPARAGVFYPSRRLRRWLVRAALLLVVCLAGLGALAAHVFLRTGGEPRQAPVFVPSGATFSQVAQAMEKDGLIHDADSFLLLIRLVEPDARLRAGEFVIDASWRPLRVLEQLTRGQPVLHRLQVREGLAWWEVGRLVEEAGLGSFASFERAVSDPALLARHGVPFATAEGFLFPETYLLTRSAENDARPVVEAMLREFWRTAREVWPASAGGPPVGADLARLVTLASIVEKETGQGDERATVAGVYANRLRIGMPMQADPTVIYGIGPSFDGNLRRTDLENAQNPYNTYRHPGLPPGPICSPGKASLEAAVRPEKHGYLYFVSRADGTHQFSTNLDDHNAAVRKYQLRRR